MESQAFFPNGGVRLTIDYPCPAIEDEDAGVMAQTLQFLDDKTRGLSALHDEVSDLFVKAGFDDVRSETTTLDLDLLPLKDFLPRHVSATPMASPLANASAERRDAVVKRVEREWESYATTAGRLRVPFRVHIASATACR